jgi:hypothetical protein
MIRDARDGQPMYVQHPNGRGLAALVNGRALKGLGGKYISFPLAPFVTEVLRRLREIDPRELSDDSGGSDDALEVLEAKRDNLKARIAELRSELESGASEVRAAVASLRAMETELDDVTAEAARLRAETATPLTETLADGHGLIDALATARDPAEARLRLKSALRRLVEEVRVLVVPRPGRVRIAAAQLYFTGGSTRSYLIVHRPAQKNQHTDGRPAATWSRSLTGKEMAGKAAAAFDLRRPADAAALEKALAGLDVAELAEEPAKEKRGK